MLNDPIVQELLVDVTSDEKNSTTIIECLLAGKTVDLDIVEETEIPLNTVRKVLYKLNDASIISYKKAKDPETNYDIYIWKFEQENVSQVITKKYGNILEEIKKSIKYEEENMFFSCNAYGHRYIFEKASEYNFVCPKCKGTLEYQDNTIVIEKLLKEKIACDQILSKGE